MSTSYSLACQFCSSHNNEHLSYEGGDGVSVNEESPTVDPDSNPRAGRLVRAEREVLAAGGCVLRLAGLYLLERGAHNFWLTSGKPIAGRPDGLINLLHYDDAASACLAAVKAGPQVCKGKCFLVSDGNPQTRSQICESALLATMYKGFEMPAFQSPGKNGPPQSIGKVYDGSRTEKLLSWKPLYESFPKFMSSQ